ncbi:MAG TPA: PC4/YdbC family ssDNA-binding protein [Spirochaetales bacterium]|nr:PC4/YdbC family ssDNA-binding protein [Spirochaetales bacterium]
MEDREIKFVLVERLGALGESSRGWATELNLVSWNERPPKFDIRPWDPSHERMGKGVTLSEEEARKLSELLAARFAAS